MWSYVIISALAILILLLIPFTRAILLEVWQEVVKPLLLKQLPRLLHWLIEAHLIFARNMLPRSLIIKSINAKYQSIDRK